MSIHRFNQNFYATHFHRFVAFIQIFGLISSFSGALLSSCRFQWPTVISRGYQPYYCYLLRPQRQCPTLLIPSPFCHLSFFRYSSTVLSSPLFEIQLVPCYRTLLHRPALLLGSSRSISSIITKLRIDVAIFSKTQASIGIHPNLNIFLY